jgi:starch phosphorylase
MIRKGPPDASSYGRVAPGLWSAATGLFPWRARVLPRHQSLAVLADRMVAFLMEQAPTHETAPKSPAADAGSFPPDSAAVAALRAAILEKLTYAIGKDPGHALHHDWYMATALAVRDRIIENWMDSTRRTYRENRKRVYYLSLEFLIGRQFFDAMATQGLTESVRAALADLSVDLEQICILEPDPALGNGGLGRLAACFLESMSTLGIAAYGYGIRYDYGIFRQVITDGWQEEYPDDWLATGNPWEFERPEVAYGIGFGGRVTTVNDASGVARSRWEPAEMLTAVGFDTPICGWRGRHVNTLRLWYARAHDPVRLDSFNRGDHIGASAERLRHESISLILYPSNESPAGQELRLRQEFFFASASLQDILRRHRAQHGDVLTLPDHAVIQLNDTHPAIAIAEMMRLLTDVRGLSWDQAWRITTSTFNYTNHTLLPEALETWSVHLLERLLPRHMQIIYLINSLHLEALRARGETSGQLVASTSLIAEDHVRQVRMGHLAFLGSRRVNGVSALHTKLMRETVFGDLAALYPDRIVNKTNGISFRRWLGHANPRLTQLVVEAVGVDVLDDAAGLERLIPLAEDPQFRERFADVRRANKIALTGLIRQRSGVDADPEAIFDVQVKRFHEYKRQLLNILETIGLANAIRAESTRDWVPRVKIFAGKAAAGYAQAKLIIKLANDVSRIVNEDRALRGLLRVVFLPDYNVSLAEKIIPAADVSEQISTAGMEASGTGNMKLALNGAITLGTLDGANIEIQDRVGADNVHIFGLVAAEVSAKRAAGIDAADAISASPALAEVLDQLASGAYSPDDPGRYAGLVDRLRHYDYFMVCSDFDSYWQEQRRIDARWRDRPAWWRTSILNTAKVGWFSADRAIREYADEIWRVELAPR